jgi:hypothetical protein
MLILRICIFAKTELMKKFVLPLLLVIIYTGVNAQDKVVKGLQETNDKKGFRNDTTHKEGWKKGGVFTLNVGQGSSSNWAAGAEKFSLSVAGNISVFADYRRGKFKWDNSLDLGYAMVNTTSTGLRKTDDRLDFYSKMGHSLSEKLSISGVVNFRTQFSKGFDYNYLGKGYQRKTSDFMSPGYLVLAPGLDWHPVPYFNVFFSPISSRFVFVINDPNIYYFPNGVIPIADGGGFELPLAALYGVDPARKVRAELGAFVSANFAKEIFKNISYKSRLDLYSNYLKSYRYTATGPNQLDIEKQDVKPQNVDIYWTNLIVMKINKFLNVTYNFDLIYDDDVRQFGPQKTSAATQIRSLLAVGVSLTF